MLTQRSAQLLMRMVQQEVDASNLIAAAKQLSDSHPAMAPLWNLLQLTRRYLHQSHKLKEAVKRFVSDMKAHAQIVSTQAAKCLPEGIIVTHSYSSIVFQALVKAHRQGKNLQVICSASYPGGEGIALAKSLMKEGIDATLTFDLQTFSWLSKCKLFLVGADALCLDGLVHKVGTCPLAVTAKQFGVPVWCLATSEKKLPLRWEMRMKGQSISIVNSDLPQDKTVYDLTEWKFISEVILETKVDNFK